jgi:hypothetical protein
VGENGGRFDRRSRAASPKIRPGGTPIFAAMDGSPALVAARAGRGGSAERPGDGAAPRSVFRAAAKVGHIGACRVTGKKADDEAETGCTDGERKLRICHGPQVINSRHAEQTDLRDPRISSAFDNAGGASLSHRPP